MVIRLILCVYVSSNKPIVTVHYFSPPIYSFMFKVITNQVILKCEFLNISKLTYMEIN